MQGSTVTTYNPYKGRAINPANPVRIYRNLNNGKISIKQGAYVVGHTDEVFLTEARFLISENLRQKVVEKRVKSVHAYIEGIWMDSFQLPEEESTMVWYNPYLTDKFRTAIRNEACETAAQILIKSDGTMNMWN